MKLRIAKLFDKWVVEDPTLAWGAVYYLDTFEGAVATAEIVIAMMALTPRFPLLRREFASSVKYGAA